MPNPVPLKIGSLPVSDEAQLAESLGVRRYFEADDGDAYLPEIGEAVCGIVARGELGSGATIVDACSSAGITSAYGFVFDAVDLESRTRIGIRVTDTPDVLTKDVADFGITVMLTHGRGIVAGDAWCAQVIGEAGSSPTYPASAQEKRWRTWPWRNQI